MRVDKQIVLKDLSHLLKSRFPDEVKDIVLFGSQAYGKAHKDSDYDFLIILRQKADWKVEREISDMCMKLI
ncbi:MAG: nucleotidyltransferase domain-containing protein [Salinivirgaceae bacterium]|nr:nucleotidyltransferase domain-containing protein [Salinivirgaceae bacterium]